MRTIKGEMGGEWGGGHPSPVGIGEGLVTSTSSSHAHGYMYKGSIEVMYDLSWG
jgi:hypothetical protein